MEASHIVYDKYNAELHNSSYHVVELNDGKVPSNHDILRFTIVNPSVHLKQMHLEIGGGRVASFLPEEFTDTQNIITQGLPLSKLRYHKVNLVFEYDEKFVEDNEEYIMIDECIEEKTLSDSDEEFYDGVDYHYGRRVVGYNSVPTGRKIKEIIKPAIVEVPDIHIDIVVPTTPFDEPVSIPVWQKLLITKSDCPEYYFKTLVEKHKLHVSTGEDINQLYNSDVPFHAKIQNHIRIQSGMGGLCYTFM